MNEIIQFCQSIFKPVVLIFTIANLSSMGLQVNIPQVIKKISNPKLLVMIFGWCWVIGPALGYLISKIIPLEEPYAMVVLITCLAPCAPRSSHL